MQKKYYSRVSVKLTAFYSQFDPLDAQGSERVSDRIRIPCARVRRAAVHFDMEQYAYKDLTLSILKQLLMEDEFRERDVGITIQAYLRDSEQDVRDLIAWVKQRGYPQRCVWSGGVLGSGNDKSSAERLAPTGFTTTKPPCQF